MGGALDAEGEPWGQKGFGWNRSQAIRQWKLFEYFRLEIS